MSEILQKYSGIVDDKQAKEVEAQEATTDREKHMAKVIENQEKFNAISQIESMIQIRNSHNLEKRSSEQERILDKLKASDAEQSLKGILSDIKLFQEK